MAAVPHPSQSIIVTEFSASKSKGDSSDNVVGGQACSVVNSPTIQLTAGNGKPNGLHTGKMNYLFADGHVESVASNLRAADLMQVIGRH
jgi:prepilin-type processing-associated H-X9-DG protein